MSDNTDRAVDVDPGANVALGKLETSMVGQVRDIIWTACGKIVQAYDAITPGDQRVTQMRANEARAASHYHPH
jgi:hypothetical protein